jgi:NosR/NirI family nitrous oxide reductase transcriptional regulator
VVVFVRIALAFLVASLPVTARAEARLSEFLGQAQPAELVPGGERFGEVRGEPPVAAAMAGDQLKGWVWLNSDFVGAAGYSGKPIRILAGMTPDGKLTGAKLVEHHEPIVLVGIPIAKITAFINGYVGHSVDELTARSGGAPPVDIVSGATVTVMVIGDSLTRSAARVLRQVAGGPAQAAAPAAPTSVRKVSTELGSPSDWQTLVGDGSVRRLTLSVGEVTEAFQRAGQAKAAGRRESRDPGATFIDLHVALVSVPAIGRSLLGEAGWRELSQRLQPGQHAVLVAANAPTRSRARAMSEAASSTASSWCRARRRSAFAIAITSDWANSRPMARRASRKSACSRCRAM